MPSTQHKREPLTGVFLMSIAMLMIPMVDGTAKYLSSSYSPLYISWARYAVACAIVLPLAMARLAPLVYLELLGTAAIGYVMFAERPDVYVWVGALAILLGGALLVQRSSSS